MIGRPWGNHDVGVPFVFSNHLTVDDLVRLAERLATGRSADPYIEIHDPEGGIRSCLVHNAQDKEYCRDSTEHGGRERQNTRVVKQEDSEGLLTNRLTGAWVKRCYSCP